MGKENQAENRVASDPSDSKKKASVAQKASVIIASKAITIVARITSIMVLTRVLTKEDFGLLSFVLLAYTTVTTLSQLGLPDSVFYFFERVPPKSRKSLALQTGRLLFGIGILGSMLLVVLTFLAPLWGFEVGGLFLPLILLALLELPTTLIPNILIAIDRTKQAAWFNIIVSVTLFSATVVPAALGLNLYAIVYCLAGYGVVRFCVAGWMFTRNFRGRGGPLPDGMLRQQLGYSVPLGLAQILWSLNRVIDKYIVASFLPVAVFAEYTVGAWEIPLIPMIAYSVAAVMMPDFVAAHLKGDTKNLMDLWFQSIRKVAIIVLPATVLFLLIATEFIAVFFSENYMNAALPFRIYTVILFIRVTSYSSILKAIGDTRSVTRQAIYLLLLNVAFSIPLVQMWGVAGPPTATLAANLITWVYFLARIRTGLGVEFKQVFPFAFYFKALGVAIVAAAPAYFIAQLLTLSYGSALLVKLVLYVASYASVSLLTGITTKKDWQFIGGLVGFKSKK